MLRRTRFALLGLAFCFAATSTLAQTADFTGSLSIFVDVGGGLPTTATPITGSARGVFFASDGGAFTIPSSVFSANATSPVGFTPNAPVNSIYTIRTITNTSNEAGSFSGTAGSSYLGLMKIRSPVTVELGLVPLPTTVWSFLLPIEIGSPGTATGMSLILTNALSVTVTGQGWTTGTVMLVTTTVSPPSSAVFSGSNNLSASGGTITLVAPFTVVLSGAVNQRLAGLAQLSLRFSNKVPEPRAILLLGLAAAAATLASAKRR